MGVHETPKLWCGPYIWRCGLLVFGVAPRVRVTDTHTLVWHLELRILAPVLQRGPLTWRYGLPTFGAAPRVGNIDFHSLVSPFELAIEIPTLRCGPSNCGYRLTRFGGAPLFGDTEDTLRCGRWIRGSKIPRLGVAPHVGDADFHSLVWPLGSEIRTPMCRCGPSNWRCLPPHIASGASSSGCGLGRFGLALGLWG